MFIQRCLIREVVCLNLLETIIVACGLSLDVCALMMCKGALFPTVGKEKVCRICVILACSQMAALLLGNAAGSVIRPKLGSDEVWTVLTVLSVLIFAGLGIIMFSKAWRNESVFESRKDTLETREIFVWAPAVSMDALLAGIGFSFLGSEIVPQTVAVGAATVIAAVLGLKIGFMLGYEQKTKSYVVGGILLLASGVEIAFRHI